MIISCCACCIREIECDKLSTHEDFLQNSDSKSLKCFYILLYILLNTKSIKLKLEIINDKKTSDGFIIFMGHACGIVKVM